MAQRNAIAVTAGDLFEDAEGLQQEALKLLENGDIRDAAEKAWCAIVAATRGLLVARGRERPDTTTTTGTAFDALTERDKRLEDLSGRFHTALSSLHGRCFYDGVCEPQDTVVRRIRAVTEYIQNARRLARS